MDTHVEPGLYLLAASSAFLAFMNAFVTKAAFQVELDTAKRESHATRDSKLNLENVKRQTTEVSGAPEDAEASRQIRPVPVLFSDRFRWCLVGQDD